MARRGLLPLLLLAGASLQAVQAQSLSKLPDWAQAAIQSAGNEKPPAEADAWILLDRTEVAYAGDGEVRTRKLKVVRILGERGISEGTFAVFGLGGKASKVKKLKGWNLRPDGELVKLDSDSVVTMTDVGEEDFGTATLTGASLERVAKESYVAFESVEVLRHPLGPIMSMVPLESHPIRRFELELVDGGSWPFSSSAVRVGTDIDLVQFQPWLPLPEVVPAKKVVAMNLPARPKEEGACPDPVNFLPRITLRFHDANLKEVPDWKSWDSQASWLETQYRAHLADAPELGLPHDWAGVGQLLGWMAKELTYRQVYLTPERGWIPDGPGEIGRRRFGDCKDLSCFLISQAQRLGFEGHPVLARTGRGFVDPKTPPAPIFNHVLTALRLPKSLGLPAEVDTPEGRFLLIDPTHPTIPLGRLGDEHRGRWLLICTAQGGHWVQVPDPAIVEPGIRVELEGEADATGKVTAKVRLEETGETWGLRDAALRLGASRMREYILNQLLNLPPTATLTVEGQSDPRQIDRPFTVTLALSHPAGLRVGGGEAILEDWWMGRIVPTGIQRAGHSRISPVVKQSAEHLRYSVSLKTPQKLVPVMASKAEDTPFRAFTWKASTEPRGEGVLLRLELDHRDKPASFAFETREQGLQAWKKDRSVARNLVADGLAFKIQP